MNIDNKELENAILNDDLGKFKELEQYIEGEEYFIDFAFEAFKVHAYSIFDYIIKNKNIDDTQNLNSGRFFNGVEIEDINTNYSKYIYSKTFITDMVYNINYVDPDSIKAVKRALQVMRNVPLELYRLPPVYYDSLNSENYSNKQTGKNGERQFQKKGNIISMCLETINTYRKDSNKSKNLLMYEKTLVAIYDLLEYIILNKKISKDDICEEHKHHNRSRCVDAENTITVNDIINDLDNTLAAERLLYINNGGRENLNKRLLNIINDIKKLLRRLQNHDSNK